MNIYQKNGIWYAPDWRAPSGAVLQAHSLRTRDRDVAETAWIVERARLVEPRPEGAAAAPPSSATLEPAPRSGLCLSDAMSAYLIRKEPALAPRTVDGYWASAGRILLTLEDFPLSMLEGEQGTRLLDEWARDEVERLGGRTHTVVKGLESIIKPALRLAHYVGDLRRLPLFPVLKSDYRAHGKRVFFLTRVAFAALRAELPEVDVIAYRDGTRFRCYPRLWVDIAVSTGMHDSDVNRFRGSDWDAGRGLWLRTNTKGAGNYGPEWFPADAYLALALQRAAEARGGAPAGPWVVEGTPRGTTPWMRWRLIFAARRAGIKLPPGEDLSSIHFRHTFATWRRDDGWTFEETARVLGNSSGMVREVYAQVPEQRFLELAGRAAGSSAQLLSMTQSLEGKRRGPKNARHKKLASSAVVPTVVNRSTGGLQHGENYRKEG